MKQKNKNGKKLRCIYTGIIAIVLLIAAIHSLVYAVECSYICNNMDSYLQASYYGRCVDFYDYKRAIRIKWGSREQWYGFALDNGDLLGSAKWDMEDCGFDADLFQQCSNQPMAFAYTRTLRPFSSAHKLINISIDGRWLLSDRVDSMSYEASGFYFVFAVFLVLVILLLLPTWLPRLVALNRKRRNRRNRRRKREKRENFLKKQNNSQKENEE